MKQISVLVENHVGSLAAVTALLKEAHVNIKAIASFDSPSYGILRMVVDAPEQAALVLQESHFAVKITDVLTVEMEDQPGALDHVFAVMAEAGIDIYYVYSFVYRLDKAPLMVLNVSDNEKARQVLKGAGIQIVEE